MKRIFKFSAMLFASVMALALGSCTEEYEYSGAKAEGEQVYFSNELPSTVNLSQSESSVQIPINRINSEGALTVDFDVTVSADSKVTVPNSVTFAEGETEANLTISYDPASIELGHYDNVTISIKDANYTTPYGNSSYTFSIGLSEWETLGEGLYRDGIYPSFYGLDALTYNVEIQQSVITPGMYRIVSPYGAGTSFYENYIETQMLAWAGMTNTDMVINATDPDYVFITGDFYPGTDDGMASSGYGVMHLFSIVDQAVQEYGSLEAVKANEPSLFGKLQDGVITFPAMGVYVNFDSSLEPLGYLDTSSLTIALPGYAFVDYSSSFTYTGRFIDIADNYYAQGTITLGEDVASARYILAAEGDDVQAIINGLNDGSVTPLETITGSTDVSIPLEDSGVYTMIIVTYDESGTMRGSSTTTFEFNIDSTKADWQPLYNGTFTHNVEPAFITVSQTDDSFVGNPLVDAEGFVEQYQTVIYQDMNNPSSYKVEPYIMNGLSLPFTMDAEGNITFLDVMTGFSVQGYGDLFAGDAITAINGEGNVGTSWFDAENNQFVFGTVFYLGEIGQWMGGAYETFDITSSASAPAYNKYGKARFIGKLPNAKTGGAKHFKSSGVKTSKADIKGNLVKK